MMFTKVSVICFLSLAAIVAASEQVRLFSVTDTVTNGKVLTPEFDKYASHLMELWDVKGVTMAVVKPDGTVEYGAWGNKTEDGERMTPDTLFNIASCSKAFLSASIGILMDDFAHDRNSTPLPGHLSTFDWTTKVKDLLPGEWELQDEWTNEKANVLDTLSHMSGMPRHDASYSNIDSTADIARRMKHLRPAYELRQHWSYNNQMYMLGAHIISKYSGPYIEFVDERIFKPLGMNASTYSPLAADGSGKLTQSWTAHGQRIPFWFPEQAKHVAAGAGGVISSVVDLSKWIAMLLHSGVSPLTGKSVVPKSAFERATTAYAVARGKARMPELSIEGYGMGWDRMSLQGHEVVAHGGAIPGFSTYIAFLPNDNFGTVVLINTADKGEVAVALTSRVAEDLLGLKRLPFADDPSAPYPKRPERPENATIPLPLSAYSGTYGNEGYGSFTLCDPAGSSFYCNEVLSDFNAVDNATSSPRKDTIPQLVGAWPRMWSSHVRLSHFENNTFNLSLPALFPEGYGVSKTPFDVSELDLDAGEAEFVVEDGKVVGFGFYGLDEGMAGKRGGGISVKDGAIAWFEKV